MDEQRIEAIVSSLETCQGWTCHLLTESVDDVNHLMAPWASIEIATPRRGQWDAEPLLSDQFAHPVLVLRVPSSDAGYMSDEAQTVLRMVCSHHSKCIMQARLVLSSTPMLHTGTPEQRNARLQALRVFATTARHGSLVRQYNMLCVEADATVPLGVVFKVLGGLVRARAKALLLRCDENAADERRLNAKHVLAAVGATSQRVSIDYRRICARRSAGDEEAADADPGVLPEGVAAFMGRERRNPLMIAEELQESARLLAPRSLANLLAPLGRDRSICRLAHAYPNVHTLDLTRTGLVFSLAGAWAIGAELCDCGALETVRVRCAWRGDSFEQHFAPRDDDCGVTKLPRELADWRSFVEVSMFARHRVTGVYHASPLPPPPPAFACAIKHVRVDRIDGRGELRVSWKMTLRFPDSRRNCAENCFRLVILDSVHDEVSAGSTLSSALLRRCRELCLFEAPSEEGCSEHALTVVGEGLGTEAFERELAMCAAVCTHLHVTRPDDEREPPANWTPDTFLLTAAAANPLLESLTVDVPIAALSMRDVRMLEELARRIRVLRLRTRLPLGESGVILASIRNNNALVFSLEPPPTTRQNRDAYRNAQAHCLFNRLMLNAAAKRVASLGADVDDRYLVSDGAVIEATAEQQAGEIEEMEEDEEALDTSVGRLPGGAFWPYSIDDVLNEDELDELIESNADNPWFRALVATNLCYGSPRETQRALDNVLKYLRYVRFVADNKE